MQAVQVDGGSGFMAEFRAACGARGIKAAVLPPKSPKMSGRAGRMQAILRNGIYSVQDTAASVSQLSPLIDRYLAFHSGERPRDALDGLAPRESLKSLRIGKDQPSHVSCAGTSI